ncbi:PTS glucose transporter subunit IIA [Collinsella sp. AGMB00827]|uniref:PTS glucose transporter subunit IIA n=1 Tax=Collinsella ureilytica TaxID=2869515 RepID=A0ABS7MJ56_9ACTN|nr:PTS glucose transporter subunit IIA [Collinsella urealyticum]MBY4797287.1 PTS glucose transporter subunit IIA [Collinsella urealyticum]
MFDRLLTPFRSRRRPLILASPLAGRVVSLGEVNDEVFASGMLGEGVAIQPLSNRVVAPADAKVEVIFPTGHAVALRTDDGLDILIHLGLNTVNLNGEHFVVHAQPGDTVRRGQVLIEFDRRAIASAGFDTIVPVLLRNALEFSSVKPVVNEIVNELDDLIRVRPR